MYKSLLKIVVGFLGLGFYTITLGAGIDHFELIANPAKIKAGETIDLTVKAVDKDGNKIKDYAGEILIFSQTDPKAEFPGALSENTYKFKASDAGEVKFENAVKFTKNGLQDINVYDIANEDIFGYAEIDVGQADQTETKASDITISSPENGTTLGTDKIKVNGTTLKNHKIKLLLDKDKKFDAISNSEGNFSVDLDKLSSGEHKIKAQILDSSEKVIGESTEITFKIESSKPKFESIKINPEGEVDTETVLNVEVKATAGLTEINLVSNDVVEKLSEKSAGIYTGTITAPKEVGEFKIDLVMKNELGLETKASNVATIKTKKPILNAAAETPKEEKKEINCEDLKKGLVVSGIKLTKLKSKSILSWDKVKEASSYNVYKKNKQTGEMTLIQNIVDTKLDINITGDVLEYDDFAVKAVLKNDACQVESSDFSTMTKVQTGPKEIALVIVAIMLTTGIFFLRRRSI